MATLSLSYKTADKYMLDILLYGPGEALDNLLVQAPVLSYCQELKAVLSGLGLPVKEPTKGKEEAMQHRLSV